MTIAQRQAPATNGNGSVTAITATLTSNPTAGDVIVVWAHIKHGYTATCADTIGDGVGWTAASFNPISQASNNMGVVAFYKTVGSTITGKTITVTGSGTVWAMNICAIEYYSDVPATFSVQESSASGSSAAPAPGNIVLAGTGAWAVTGAVSTYYTLTPGTGYTEQYEGANYRAFAVEEQFFSSAATVNPDWTCTSSFWAAAAIALKATTLGPQITSSTAAPVHGSTGNTITGTAFQAAQGTGGAVIGGQAQVETAWADTSITYTADRGVNLNGVAVNVVVTDNDGLSSGNYALTGFQPPAGYEYVTLTSVNTTAAYRITAIADLAIGNQLEWDNALVTINADGTYVADPSVTSFNVRVGVTGDGWGALALQTVGSANDSDAAMNGRAMGLGLKLGRVVYA